MLVLQIGPTYQTCIYFAEKLMVLRCYDHNLNTDRKRRLWIWSGLFSVAFYENAAVRILRTAITLTRPTLHLCHKQSRLYFPLAFQTRPRWSLGFVQGIAAGACALQLPATTTRTIATFASFVSQTKITETGMYYLCHPWNLCITKVDEPMFCPKSYYGHDAGPSPQFHLIMLLLFLLLCYHSV